MAITEEDTLTADERDARRYRALCKAADDGSVQVDWSRSMRMAWTRKDLDAIADELREQWGTR